MLPRQSTVALGSELLSTLLIGTPPGNISSEAAHSDAFENRPKKTFHYGVH
jgi:hypothetical protein